jgi:hypothetical protein
LGLVIPKSLAACNAAERWNSGTFVNQIETR